MYLLESTDGVATTSLAGRISWNVWSAAELQAERLARQLVCADVFGLWWSQRLHDRERRRWFVIICAKPELQGRPWPSLPRPFRQRGLLP